MLGYRSGWGWGWATDWDGGGAGPQVRMGWVWATDRDGMGLGHRSGGVVGGTGPQVRMGVRLGHRRLGWDGMGWGRAYEDLEWEISD